MRMLLLETAYRRKQTDLKNTSSSSSRPSYHGLQSNKVSGKDVLTLDWVQPPPVADGKTGQEVKQPAQRNTTG